MATEVGIRELKNALSRYIERVESGEIVTVTKRGKPVARVIPAGISPGMAKLIEEGVVKWSGKKISQLPEPTPLIGDGPTAAEYVIEGRR